RDREHAIARLVAHHRLEHVGRLAEPAPPERGVAHRAHECVDAVDLREIERRERIEAVVVAASVALVVARAGQTRSPGFGVGSERVGPWHTEAAGRPCTGPRPASQLASTCAGAAPGAATTTASSGRSARRAREASVRPTGSPGSPAISASDPPRSA